ncbi:MAG: hypothetical protein NWF05_05415 [Candidatus Bathyarchaeota archaeon]|nr:hypothetical protein [Candidatus Bathyarchaeota archaeon]
MYAKEMLKSGSVNEEALAEKAFSHVVGKSIDDIRKLPIEELDLNPKLNDAWEAVHQAMQPSAINYQLENTPLLSEHFRPDYKDKEGLFTRLANCIHEHPVAAGIALTCITFGATAAAFGAHYCSTNQASSQHPEDGGQPVFDYATQKGITSEVVKHLSPLDADGVMDGDEKAFVDYLSTVTPSLQYKVVEDFLAEGTISHNEGHHVCFLESLPQAEQEQIIKDGNSANLDIDGDGMDSYFEHFVNKTPYNVYNGRYALVLETTPGRGAGDTLASFLVDEQKFEPGNVIKLCGNNATKDNFIQAIEEVSQKATENDMVYISFDGHGGRGAFCFNDGEGNNQGISRDNGLLWTEINDYLEPLNKAGKMLITTFSCAGDAPVSALSGPRRVVSDIPQYWVNNSAGLYEKVDKTPEAKLFDLDGNGYVSINELFKTSNKYSVDPDQFSIADKSGIAPDLYLGDFEVDA